MDLDSVTRSWTSARKDTVLAFLGRLQWHFASGQVLDWSPGAFDQWVDGHVALSPSGRWIATVDQHGTVRTLYPPDEKAKLIPRVAGVRVAAPRWLSWSRDGNHLATEDSTKKGTVSVINATDAKIIEQPAVLADHGAFVGSTLLVVDERGALVEATTGRVIARKVLGLAACGASHARVFADHVEIVDSSGATRTLRGGRPPPILSGRQPARAAASSDCGVVVVLAKDGNVHAWVGDIGPREVSDGEVAAVDPRGAWIATAGNGKIRVLDARSLSALWETEQVGNLVTALAVDPRGRFLVSGDSYGEIAFWEPRSGKQLGVTRMTPVSALAIDPGGQALAAGGSEGVVKILDLASLDAASENLRQRIKCASGLRFVEDRFEDLRDTSPCLAFLQ